MSRKNHASVFLALLSASLLLIQGAMGGQDAFSATQDAPPPFTKSLLDPTFKTAFPTYAPTIADKLFLKQLRTYLADSNPAKDADQPLRQTFAKTSFPKSFYGFALVIYQPKRARLIFTRVNHGSYKNIKQVIERVHLHPRYREFDLASEGKCRLQIDFILREPLDVKFKTLNQQTTDGNRFEMGVDGLCVKYGKKMQYFLPGDAYVRSILSMNQLKRHLQKFYRDAPFDALYFSKFRTESYVSFKDTWLRLYRGYPLVGPPTREKLVNATNLGLGYILKHQKADGTFLYYYDSSIDSFRDFDHPDRDPEKNPYYNLLRHIGAVGLLVHEYQGTKNPALLPPIRKAIDYYLKSTPVYTLDDGSKAAYLLDNGKGKLGGSGVALWALAFYQHATHDNQYESWTRMLNNHLIHQITPSGEFMYYCTYLGKRITVEENPKYFSFYYPGEAIVGLASYYKYVATKEEKKRDAEKIKLALRYLIVERPKEHKDQFATLPSDAWLMMGINDLWDEPEMRETLYKDFVFSEADQMINYMYRIDNALFADYPGAFYYTYGDFPYADGARSEGLVGALELAVKLKDAKRIKAYRDALILAHWAQLHLVNTEESSYSFPRPELAIGGIRFKHTRQWFRVDTIGHVAGSYLKFLPYWKEGAED